MTDPKKNPNKRRRSFFWRRKPQLPLEPPKPAPLEDGSTAEFMRQFYGALAKGDTKAAALQSAQRAFIEDERYHHPYYWAAFELMGDTGRL